MMSARLEMLATPIPGLCVVQRRAVGDERGWLERVYCSDELRPVLRDRPVAQVNRTLTGRRGTVRGMHFQRPPHAEAKLVSCLRGRIFDVAVDLRRGSPTLLAWHGEELTADNRRSLLIPEGFAHGFQALADDCELLYLHTAPYVPEAEGGVNPRDPALAIAWPEPIGAISERDAAHPLIGDGFTGLEP